MRFTRILPVAAMVLALTACSTADKIFGGDNEEKLPGDRISVLDLQKTLQPDTPVLDAEGFCTILDRTEDMLIRGGENIYCGEVENVLLQHPAVADAALVGLAHPVLGEVPAVAVQLRSGVTVSEEELKAFAAEKLAAFKVPVRFRLWRDALPRNEGGKLMKSQLRKAFES